jgi:hypothetical protein
MKDWLVNYIRDNIQDLLRADLHIARLLGAPRGLTLSGWAHKEKSRWEPVINWFFRWLWNQEDHCKKAYAEDLERMNA